jgi:hypothetical protein
MNDSSTESFRIGDGSELFLTVMKTSLSATRELGLSYPSRNASLRRVLNNAS